MISNLKPSTMKRMYTITSSITGFQLLLQLQLCLHVNFQLQFQLQLHCN